MGLWPAEATLSRVNPLRQAVIRLGAQPWLPRLAPVIVPADKALFQLTRGRMGLMSVTGLLHVTLTVVGRRSGRLRSVPLLGVPYGSGWLVAGSNWGEEAPPAWAANLVVAKRCVITHRGWDTPMAARVAQGAEREDLWSVMLRTWPNWAQYAERANREIPVFVLTPCGPPVRHERSAFEATLGIPAGDTGSSPTDGIRQA